MKGSNWPLGPAPLAVQAPDNGADDGWDVDAFVEYHILGMGANAIHRALQGRFPNANDHRMLQLAEQHGFFVLFWIYGDRDSNSAPVWDDGSPKALGHDAAWQFGVIDALEVFSHNFGVGPGYDGKEWIDDNQSTRFVRRLRKRYPWLLVGCRTTLTEERRDPTDPNFQRKTPGWRAGNFASFEHQLLGDKTDYRFEEMLRLAHAPSEVLEDPVHRPVIAEERLRVGERPKDFATAAALAPAIRAHRAANVGLVVGIRDAGPNWRWPIAAEETLRAAFTGGGVPSLVLTVERERDKFGIPLTNPQMGIILNNVCLQHPGWGMARKDEGFHTLQPITDIPISRDRLIHGPTGRMYDVLEDVAGRAIPTWNFIGPADLPFVPPVGSAPPTEDRMIIDINDLQTFRVAASPHPDHDHKWGSARHWPAKVPEIAVAKVNETNETFICYGLGYFIGMEADKQDEITAEPRVRAKDTGAGRLLPLKVEEKDSPGMAFDSADFYALPAHIRIRPGDEMSGLFQHSNTGTKTDEGQTPEDANQPHAHITFYCYRERS